MKVGLSLSNITEQPQCHISFLTAYFIYDDYQHTLWFHGEKKRRMHLICLIFCWNKMWVLLKEYSHCMATRSCWTFTSEMCRRLSNLKEIMSCCFLCAATLERSPCLLLSLCVSLQMQNVTKRITHQGRCSLSLILFPSQDQILIHLYLLTLSSKLLHELSHWLSYTYRNLTYRHFTFSLFSLTLK